MSQVTDNCMPRDAIELRRRKAALQQLMQQVTDDDAAAAAARDDDNAAADLRTVADALAVETAAATEPEAFGRINAG